MKNGTAKKPRAGTLFGRTRSRRKENVAVYCDERGETRVEVWTIHQRRGSLRMSLEAARVLHKALSEYLDAA